MMRLDLTGQTYGQLTVISYTQNCRWLCRCTCGELTTVAAGHIRSGHTVSCGCRQKSSRLTHGATLGRKRLPEHHSWHSALQRCTNSKCRSWANYGGRGIRVCAAWRDFATFYRDMGPKPGPDYSLDRIDVDGNYEPCNCRWATVMEQAANKRKRVKK